MGVLNTIQDLVEELKVALDGEWLKASAKELGLDPRAQCSEMWASEEGIAASGSTRALDYYGGFEYVDKVFVTRFGDVTIYSAEDNRVREHLYRFLPKDEVRRLAAYHGELEDEEQ